MYVYICVYINGYEEDIYIYIFIYFFDIYIKRNLKKCRRAKHYRKSN